MSLFTKMASPQKVVLLACGSFNPPTNMHLRMFEIARDALQKTGKYNVIAGIVSPVSDGYKKKDLAPAKHRCAMVRQALKSSKWIRVDSWESEQPTWTETERVLAHFKVELNNQANCIVKAAPSKKRKKDLKNEDEIDRGIDRGSPRHGTKEEHDSVQLKLLCGGDVLESFAVPGLWKDEDIEEIVKNYGLVVITRGGSNPQKFIYESDVLTKYQIDEFASVDRTLDDISIQNNIHIVTEWIFQDVSSTKIRRALRRGESVKYLLQDSVIDYVKEHQLYGIPCDNKYKDEMPSFPIIDTNQLMDYVDGYCNPDSIPSQNVDRASRSPARISSYMRPHSPMPVGEISETRYPRRSSASNSPKRMVAEEEAGNKSPKSPQHGPCMTDISTIVRRVRNVRVGFPSETRVFAYTTETCV